MTLALMLLVFTLAVVLFHDRDFWFPDELQVQDDTQEASLAATARNVRRKHSTSKAHRERTRPEAAVDSVASADKGQSVATTRMVSSPLEVEVVAADSHRKLHLGSNIVQVDLERASSLSGAKPRVFVDSSPSGLR
ncbi:MAG: hypothetical protein ACM3WP_10805 [Acidobacteriota bacterium]